MKTLTNSGHMKGVAMNKTICGHVYLDGNGAVVAKPDGDGVNSR